MAVASRPIVPSRLGHGPSVRVPRGKLGAYIALTKPRIIELLLITTVPTMILAEGGLPDLGLVLATLAGGALAAGGANAINMVVDRDIDRLMHRTSGRPLVTGAVSVESALAFAITLEVAAFVLLWTTVNLLSGVLALSATLFYVFVYTLWLKRTSRQNIVIGGAAGAVPVLVGWSAVTGTVGWPAVVLFLVIFLWTPPHFWALAIRYADDYRAAAVPMLPAVADTATVGRQMLAYTLALWVTTLVLVPVADLGWIYGIAAATLGAIFVAGCVDLSYHPTAARAMRLFTWSISYV